MSLAPAEPVSAPSHRASGTRALAVLATLALVALGVAWETTLAPLPGGSGRLAWKVLPLVVALPGLFRYRLYTYRWLSLLIWVYVAEGLVRSPTESGMARLLAGGEVALGVLVFAACALHVRIRLQDGAPQQPASAT